MPGHGGPGQGRKARPNVTFLEKLMALLRKQDILKADDRPIETVNVPEWSGEVLVRGLTGQGRGKYFAAVAGVRAGPGGPQMAPDITNAQVLLVSLSIIDPDDPARERLMFTPDEVAELGGRSSVALGRVEEVAMRLSGMTDEEMDLLGKPSGSTPSGGSTST